MIASHNFDPITSSQLIFVEVAVFAPLPGTFTYIWPMQLGTPEVGIRVKVPFGNGGRTGVLLGEADRPEEGVTLKAVIDRLDEEPLFDSVRNRWLQRIGRYYLVQPGELWSTAFGWAGLDDVRRFRCSDCDALTTSFPQLAGAFRSKALITLKTILSRVDDPLMMRYSVRRAVAAGVIDEVMPEPIWVEASGQSVQDSKLSPTIAQKQATKEIVTNRNQFKPFLLFGCTGSGKTEVYLNAAEKMIENGGQVLVLVPEIGLTPLWLARLKSRFERVAIWHSAMTPPERLKVREHLPETQILIGTRSALFLPLNNLKMIVVDEEHDGSFKQQEGMSYSARDMAVLLAQELDIPVVLGSATPSLESWRQVQAGNYSRLDLTERVAEGAASVSSEVIDMRGVDAPLSEPLLAALKQNLAAGEQSILFLNRRGYAPALQCTACGDVPECSACSMRLTLHRRAGQLRCHSCGYRRRVPKTCECCGEVAFLPLGEGVEKLEEFLHEQLPELKFDRFDRDVITSHARLEHTLSIFERGDTDCLIGTQMLVKGHDFPNVTLVGVINADLGVSLPDFRAGERWWQQMTQVTGRAGRGAKAGRVLIQTRMPEAPWLNRVDEAQAEATLNEEMQLREMLQFPPFARWVRIVFSSGNAERANAVAEAFVSQCRAIEGLNISGPMPCPVERLARKYRIEVLLRDVSRKLLPWQLEPVIKAMNPPRDVRIRVDVDPQDMM